VSSTSASPVQDQTLHYIACITHTNSIQQNVKHTHARRKEIFEGVRRGFEAAFDALKEDGDERNGQDEAKIVFPDAILDYDPKKFKGWADYNAKK